MNSSGFAGGIPGIPGIPPCTTMAARRGVDQSVYGFLFLGVALLFGCQGGDSTGPGGSIPPITDRSAQVARSSYGVVASASVFATEVGAQILAEGGNAVDAAVATAFALAVTEPSMSGLGGRASTLVRLPNGTVVGFNGLNQVPNGYVPGSGAERGYERAAIPGVPATLVMVHEAYGSLSLEQVMAGAIALAEDGFRVPADEAGRWASATEELSLYPASRATWLKADGSPYSAGELFRNPALARTLGAISVGGRDGFYAGWVADSIDADMTRNSGFITRAELAGFDALPAIPATGSYRGYRIVSNFRPASGHAVVEALQILEEVDLPGVDREAAWAVVVSQAMQIAISERGATFGSEAESAALLTSREHAQNRASEIEVPTALIVPTAQIAPASFIPAERAPSAVVGARRWTIEGPDFPADAFSAPPGTLVTAATDRENTTHMAVADASGMVVTHTQSNGPAMGTRLTASGLGFFYATRLGAIPGSRPSSTISPTLVLHQDGSPFFAVGGAGDARIISAVVQVISRHLDHGMTLEQAIAAPRVHPSGRRAFSAEVGPVSAWSADDLAQFQRWGFELQESPSGFFGRVHAVEFDGSTLLGVAEPRWTGSAVGVGG